MQDVPEIGNAELSDPWRSTPLPGPMPVPTMLAQSELDYLYWLASSRYTGRGRICELGCFLGGSTWALARGLADRPDAASLPPLLTYDAFEMDADTAARFPLGYKAGESFRPLFERYLAPLLGRITVREGFIPRDLDPAREPEVYPEQQPIEVLFVDAAKTWLVHNTILRCFGRHLVPGSVLVQQDFKHFGAYWIPLHMWQLRACFEPLHDVRGGASFSFLYRGGLTERLGELWGPKSIAAEDIPGRWDTVHEYWREHGSPAVGWFMRLCRATHLAAAGEAEPSIGTLEEIASGYRAGEGGEDEPALAAEFGMTCAMARRLLSRGTLAAADADRLNDLEGRGITAATSPDGDRKRCRWQSLARELNAAGYRRIALYGAGRHTADLLRTGWPHGQVRVAAILDDYAIVPSIQGIPVLRPDQAPDIDAVVISSDAKEEALAEAAERVFGGRVPIIRIYGDPAPLPAGAAGR